jgi:hypothetical protein
MNKIENNWSVPRYTESAQIRLQISKLRPGAYPANI